MDFLALGYEQTHSKLKNDANHYLDCIDLHQATSRSLLEVLAKLKDLFINEILESRNK